MGDRSSGTGAGVAEALLSATSSLVADPAVASDPDDASLALIELIKGCLKESGEAPTTARALLDGLRPGPEPSPLQSIAATEIFLRHVQMDGDPDLRDFVLSGERRRFQGLPLLELVAGQFAVRPPSAGDPTVGVACRHLMGSTVAELAAIRKALPGLTFTEVMGKAYSANRLAVLAATADGLSVSGDSLDMPELGSRQFGSFALWHRANARALVERYIADDSVEKSGPLLVVDDGGALIDAVGQAVLDGKIQQAVLAVEQTTHGLFAVQRFMKLPAARQRGFACVSVARSEAKLRLESKLIARSVAATTDYWLKLFGRPLRNVGIIGFGAVGAQLARELSSRDIEVRIYDKNPNKLAVADTVDGFEVAWTLPALLRRSEIIVGASGGTSIDFESTQHLQDNAILVSASSGDLEFSGLARWSLRLQPVLPRAAGLAPYDLAHGLLEATPADPLDNRTIHVVNRGFPVNFDGSPDPIPASEIQLTRALILGAVLQAAGGVDGEPLSGKTGLFELDRSVDHYVVEQYNKINGG